MRVAAPALRLAGALYFALGLAIGSGYAAHAQPAKPAASRTGCRGVVPAP